MPAGMANVTRSSVQTSRRIHASRSEGDGSGCRVRCDGRRAAGCVARGVVGMVGSRIWLFGRFVYAVEGDGAGVLRTGGDHVYAI